MPLAATKLAELFDCWDQESIYVKENQKVSVSPFGKPAPCIALYGTDLRGLIKGTRVRLTDRLDGPLVGRKDGWSSVLVNYS